ncbi:MAG: hypothetical protein AABZ44_03950, partial [Elusimicrobiota bacterium]
NVAESIRIKSYGIYHWDRKGAENFLGFWHKHVRLLAARNVENRPTLFLLTILEEAQATRMQDIFPPLFAQAMDLDKFLPPETPTNK